MINLGGESADAVWRQAVELLRQCGAVQESRDQPTRELLHVALTVADPRQRVVFARPINPALAVAEIIWILSGSNDTAFLRFWNPRMRRYADDDKSLFHGAYGFRLGSQPTLAPHLAPQLRHEAPSVPPRIDQLRMAYEALRQTPHSRQVVLQIWDAQRDLPNPEPRSRDIPCNVLSHLLVRNGRLEWLQVMRSNDLIWGLPYNLIQFTALQEIMAGWLGLELGTYNHVSDSLHVYRRHWEQLDPDPSAPSIPSNDADLRIGPYEQWEAVWAPFVECVWQLTQQRDEPTLLAVAKDATGLPRAYQEWAALLRAEALRRRGYSSAADQVVAGAGVYWETSWRRWLASPRAS